MKKVLKYKLTIGSNIIELKCTKDDILNVINQHNKPMLFALIDNDLPERTFEVKIILTGEEFDDINLIYLTTIKTNDDNFVGHVFYKELNYKGV